VNLPENRDVDFTWRDFHARNNNELADVLGNFVNRVAVFIKKNYAGRVPEASPDDEQSLEVLKAIAEAPGKLGRMIEAYQIKDAAREVMTLPALGNRYFDFAAPWKTFKTDRAKCDRTMNVCMRLVSSLEVLLYPFLPFTSRKMGKLLWGRDRVQSPESRIQSPERRWDDAAKPALPVELGPAEILFNKIEDSVIATQVEKLGKKEPQAPSPKQEGKSVITYDDFKKLELKVAKILSAEAVPGATKLLKLQIDLGTEQRQIVAGIALAYKPEELVGKSIVVVANLAPAVIRGVESNGMLLAATAKPHPVRRCPDVETGEGKGKGRGADRD
jgi:methionyl-tRNA synthetase